MVTGERSPVTLLYSSPLHCHCVKFLEIFERDFDELGSIRLYAKTQERERVL